MALRANPPAIETARTIGPLFLSLIPNRETKKELNGAPTRAASIQTEHVITNSVNTLRAAFQKALTHYVKGPGLHRKPGPLSLES